MEALSPSALERAPEVAAEIMRVVAACPWPAFMEARSERGYGLGRGRILRSNDALRARLGGRGPELLWEMLRIDQAVHGEPAETVNGVLSDGLGEHPVQVRYQILEAAGFAVGFLLADPDGTLAAAHGELQSGTERALSDALREVEKLTRELEIERRYLREEIDAMVERGALIGDTPQIRELLERVNSVARTDSTVLITGETGTGKELVARLVHQASARADRALVRVNCAALPGALIESELFGHERGAFTGAVTRRQGRFEVADRGTLFLDEVGELPLEMQAKLLRAIQEQEFERVGSSTPVRVDVRVVAATNRDLSAEVTAGRFRADLYYRLAVFPLHIPPLRERRADIAMLAEHFVTHYCQKQRRRCEGISPEALRWLEEYAWPGNVRELENVIERALILMQGKRIERSLVQSVGIGVAVPAPANGERAAEPGSEELVTLEEMERRYIERVLRRCDGRIEGDDGAAKVLGLAPSTLRSRMQRIGVRRTVT
jgi:formate hydrogenlyase transcriptional activator